MEELIAIIEDKLRDAVITEISGSTLILQLDNGQEIEINLDETQIEEIVDQIGSEEEF